MARSALAPARGAAPPPASGGDPAGGRRALRIALLIGAFIGMVDATIVAVAAEPMARHFGISPAAAQQTLSVYLVTVTATVPLLGRLGDRLGRREAYLAGFAVFAAGSVLAALAPGFGALLVGRAVQAVGGGLLTAGSLALTAEHARPTAAGRAVAVLVIAQAVAGLVGPPVGGVLVALWGWQAVFWAGLPVAALGVVVTLRAVPRSVPGGHAERLDVAGSVGLAALLFGLGAGVASLAGPALGDWPPPVACCSPPPSSAVGPRSSTAAGWAAASAPPPWPRCSAPGRSCPASRCSRSGWRTPTARARRSPGSPSCRSGRASR